MTDEPVGAMSHEEYIAALRKDLAATSVQNNTDAKRLAEAHAEIAKLEAEAKAASSPDAKIRAGLEAVRQKICDLF